MKKTPIIRVDGSRSIDEPPNPLDYADDRAEYEVQKEIYRRGKYNKEKPKKCPYCGHTKFIESRGWVGERVLLCTKCKNIVWEDREDALRRVY